MGSPLGISMVTVCELEELNIKLYKVESGLESRIYAAEKLLDKYVERFIVFALLIYFLFREVRFLLTFFFVCRFAELTFFLTVAAPRLTALAVHGAAFGICLAVSLEALAVCIAASAV